MRETTHVHAAPATVRYGSVDKRHKILARLRSVEGHVRGVERMVDDNAYCVDVIKQVLAIQRALDRVNAMLLEDHLEHCATTAIRSSDAGERERTIAELLEVFEMSSKL
jgi:DNA-binding FrmR family transcriptional regulator